MFYRFAKTLFLILITATPPLFAETLEQITADALRNNPELQVVEQDIAAAKGGVITARTYANPELTVAPGVLHSRGGGGPGRE